jgi:diaminopimelate decarboxylase
MSDFDYRQGALFAEDVSLETLAQEFGTPTYVYSRAALERNFRAYTDALEGMESLVCFAVKANSNIAVLNLLAQLGAGFDIVSGGELERVIAAGGEPGKVVFSGVAKQPWEIQRALELDILCFNVESEAELQLLSRLAGDMGKTARVSLRINPDVDARTHPYISTGLRENKFGVASEFALDAYRQAADMSAVQVVGIDCHIGSQLTELSPFIDALERLLVLVDQLAAQGIELRHIDVGGGLGVRYRDEDPPAIADYVAALRSRLDGRRVTLLFEPGRSICAAAGILLTRVSAVKNTPAHRFAMVDAAMNDLLRPALYQAWLDIVAVRQRTDIEPRTYDVVGPVCETGDFLGKNRRLALAAGDLLAVMDAGAYGFAMSSNYNSRCRAAEVIVDGGRCHLVRRRESLADLTRGESLLAD